MPVLQCTVFHVDNIPYFSFVYRIVSDSSRPGILVRQAPRRIVSRTSKIAKAAELEKHRRIGAVAIMRERKRSRVGGGHKNSQVGNANFRMKRAAGRRK